MEASNPAVLESPANAGWKHETGVQMAFSDTVGERAQDVEVVHPLQARGRDEVQGSRVQHAL